jgi:hypothetical protein
VTFTLTLTVSAVQGSELLKWSRVWRQPPASKDVNTEVEEVKALEAITRHQPVKI